MIAPTSKDRIQKIAKVGEGFLYIVSSLGVTGTRTEIKTDLKEIIDTAKEVTDVPCAVGFGINTTEQAEKSAASLMASSSAVPSSKSSPNTATMRLRTSTTTSKP